MSHNTIRETVKVLQVKSDMTNPRALCSAHRLSGVCLLLVFAFLATGCCSFERNWGCCQNYAHPGNDLAGCWEGNWHSDMNGHEGRLRAIITKQDEGSYHAHFKASFAVIIPFEFEIPITTADDGGIQAFESSADLGWLAGGVYSYSGQAGECEFFARYCAENGDHGTFTMRRLGCCTQNCDDCASWQDSDGDAESPPKAETKAAYEPDASK